MHASNEMYCSSAPERRTPLLPLPLMLLLLMLLLLWPLAFGCCEPCNRSPIHTLTRTQTNTRFEWQIKFAMQVRARISHSILHKNARIYTVMCRRFCSLNIVGARTVHARCGDLGVGLGCREYISAGWVDERHPVRCSVLYIAPLITPVAAAACFRIRTHAKRCYT